MKEKSFITLGPGVNVIKLFSFVADKEASLSQKSESFGRASLRQAPGITRKY
jgi:hypothetical protein